MGVSKRVGRVQGRARGSGESAQERLQICQCHVCARAKLNMSSVRVPRNFHLMTTHSLSSQVLEAMDRDMGRQEPPLSLSLIENAGDILDWR